MKKIQLAEGVSSGLTRKQLTDEELTYLKELKSVSRESLSYAQKNKVLYALDRELYIELINSRPKD